MGISCPGVFTLLATPCAAPFLGTAVSSPCRGETIEIYAVFLALGIGLALPWIAVAAFPLWSRGCRSPARGC